MKNLKFSIAWLATLALILTSCSKEETNLATQDDELIQLTFGSFLNDFKEQNKQATPGEVCRDEDPAYVMVAITDATGAYIDDGDADADDLFQVNLKWNNSFGVWETTYSEQLALPAGNYQLEHFVVYDSNDQVLWVAPRVEGSYGDYVGNELPQDIVLEEGTKPYINVDVLCYVSRNEEAYGYVFFDINLTEVENSYCIFVNYCDDVTGREYPAHFEVEVWTDGFGGEDEIVLSDSINEVDAPEEGWPTASVLCLALPDLLDDAVYYVRVSVLEHEDLNYTLNPNSYEQFTISQADIDAQVNTVPAYEHVRINCGETTGCNPDDLEADCDNDGVINRVDECPGTSPETIVNNIGCEMETVCRRIDFEEIQDQSSFTADYYSHLGVSILAGPGFPENSMILRGGTCSDNVLHSRDYPYSSVLVNFESDVLSVSIDAGDYGEDEDFITLTAYSGENATGEEISVDSATLGENQSGCLTVAVEGEGIRSVVLNVESNVEGLDNTSFADDIVFCRYE